MGVVSTNIGIDFISKETSLRYDCNYLLTDMNISKTNYYRFSELFDIVDCRVDVLNVEEFYYVEIGDISKNEDVYPIKLSWDTRNELNENYFQKIEKGDIIKPKVGDILIAKVRPNLKKYILIDETTSFYYYTSAFIVLRPKQINKPLFYALKTLFYNNLIAIARQGKGYPTISDKDLKFLKFERKLIESLRENSTSIESEIELIEKETLTLKSQIVPEQNIINEVFSREFNFNINEVKDINNKKYIHASIQDISDKNTNLRSSSRWHKLQFIDRAIFKNISEYDFLGNYLVSGGTKNGWSPECSEFEDETMVLGIDAIRKNGLLTFENLKYTNQTKSNIKDFIIKENDFFISRGNTVDLVALASVAKNIEDNEYIYPDLMIRITFDTTKINRDYLAYVFNSIIGRMYFKYAAKGKQQTMVKVSSNEIKQFVIPIIDTNEQERIVGEIKSRIEQQNSIKAKIEKLRAKIDEIIRDAIIKPKKER